jgi:hypothetical protein
MTHNFASREAVCRRCGQCCHAKIIVEGEVIYSPFPCRYLDEQTRLCTVYERRFEANPDCLTVDEAIRLGALPADCPYVRDLPDYVPPRERMTEEEFQAWMEHKERRRRASGSG